METTKSIGIIAFACLLSYYAGYIHGGLRDNLGSDFEFKSRAPVVSQIAQKDEAMERRALVATQVASKEEAELDFYKIAHLTVRSRCPPRNLFHSTLKILFIGNR